MQVEKCRQGEQDGYRFGPHGAIFTGPDGRVRAEAVGHALRAQKAELARGARHLELPQSVVEAQVQKAGPETLIAILSLMTQDPEPEQHGALTVGPAVAPDHETFGFGEEVVVKVETQVTKFFESESEDLQLVWAEVYVPNVPDAHDEFMTREGVRKLAHRFMEKAITGEVDIQHDQNSTRDLVIVESFLAGDDSTEYIPGSWVVCCSVRDPHIWSEVKAGNLNGFSMQARVMMEEREIEFDIPAEGLQGTTAPASEPGEEPHVHGFTVKLGADGEFLGGVTTPGPDGHTHKLATRSRSTDAIPVNKTEPMTGRHKHRYTFMDLIAALTGEL